MDLAVVAGKAIAWAELSDIDYQEIEEFYEKQRGSPSDDTA